MAFKKKNIDQGSGIKVSQEKKVSSKEDETLLKETEETIQSAEHEVRKNPSEEKDSVVSGKLSIVDPKVMLVGVICLILIVIIILVAKGGKKEKIPEPVNTNPQQVEPQLSDEEKLQKELNQEGYGVDAVIKDSQSSSTIPVQTDTFLKDLDGQDIPEMFEVKAITEISDFVTYTKHRAITGDGIELYWLEGKYKGQPCRLTIPYKYFKELPEEGAVICTIEIVQTKEDNKLATHFQFDPGTYDKIIKKSR